MRRLPLPALLIVVLLVVLAGTLGSAMQVQPMPPNRPERPILPDKPPTPTTVDDNDAYGYCIVGGPLAAYCAPWDLSCVPLPISYLVPKLPFEVDIIGWESSPNASPCGTKSCMLVFRCGCGQTLLDRVCH